MFLMHDDIKKEIAQKLRKIILEQFQINLEDSEIYKLVTPTPDDTMGNYAFPCFQLSKVLKKAPPKIAEELKLFWGENSHFIAKNFGPYLNFYIENQFIGQTVFEKIFDGSYFKIKLTQATPKTMIEYSQPNTHKELHVGHMRNLCLGNALVKMHRYCSYNIISTTYPGDIGTHVAKTLWYLKKYNQEPIPTHHKGAWLGKIYTKSYLKLEDEKGTPSEQKNREELTQILKDLENKNSENYKLWRETREWSITLMKDVYKWANVEFDQWYFESDVDEASLKLVYEYLEKGLFIKDDGAIGMDLSKDNLGFCLLIKSDGHGLYATKDLELARRKFQDLKIDHSIYVVDTRQSLHFKQVFKTLEYMGFPQAKQCFHLAYDFVELPDGAMSSRKGNIVPLQELISNMEATIKKDYLERYRGNWSDLEIDQTAQTVAIGAINYGMLKIDPNKKIVFDMKEWLKLDGESGPYLQYVYARINSLLTKIESSNLEKCNWNVLTQNVEKQLLFKLTYFNHIVQLSVEQYKPSYVCTYLYDVAKLFNHFYAECSIQNAKSAEIKVARIHLSRAVSLIIKNGLALLGIPVPSRM
ncbi:MAG: arginine--tRNA ligase [Bacteriovoracaceae bacterium]